jgi:signal peptidase I
MTNSTTSVKAAAVLAFLAAAYVALAAFLTGPLLILPLALIPLTAGRGILRGRVWSAYGYALYLSVQLLPIPLILARTGAGPSAFAPYASAALTLCFVFLFVSAGRSLQTSGGEAGAAMPWIALFTLSVVAYAVVQPYVISSVSMERSLLKGDRVLVQRWPLPNPARGDLTVFAYPLDRRETYVKRVIGVPGDRIRLVNKTVYRNGSPLREPYALHGTGYVDSYRDNFPAAPNVTLPAPARRMLEQNVIQGEVIVPPASYFLLGDNRDDSYDSRYWGFISRGDFVGKPLLIYDSEESSDENRTLPGRGRTRWSRLLRVP